MALNDAVLAIAGGFAGVLANPMSWLLVLAGGITLRSAGHLRIAATAVGAVLAGFESLGESPVHQLLASLGGAVAGFVLVEVWLLAILPVCLWVWRVLNSITRLVMRVVGWLSGTGRAPRPAADRDAD